MSPTRALILAAGNGGRLRPLTEGLPKPLVKLHRRPLINHVLDALHEAGVGRATVVVGYEGAQVREAVEHLHPCGMEISFVENEAWRLGNAHSIWAARDAIGEDSVVLAMADHIIDPAIARAVIDGDPSRMRLAVEFAPATDARADEATRVLVEEGRIMDLGKEIGRWNALDAGVFWCTQRLFGVMTPELRDGEAGAVFAALARAGELDAADVTGMSWIDVDTEDDLRMAGAMLTAIRGAERL
jgi:choline kinase